MPPAMLAQAGAVVQAHKGLACHVVCCTAVMILCMLDALTRASHMASLCAVYLAHTILGSGIAMASSSAGVGLMPQSPAMSWGAGRLRTVLTYANGIILIFLCLTTGTEALESLFHPEGTGQPASHIILQFLALGSHEVYFTTSHTHPLPRRLAQKCFVPLLAVVAWVGMAATEWAEVDAACCVAGALLAIATALPAIKDCGNILLQRAPLGMMGALEKARREAQACKDVLDITDCRYWSVREGEVVGSMRVRVRDEACLRSVLAAVKRPFEGVLTQHTVQIHVQERGATAGCGDGASAVDALSSPLPAYATPGGFAAPTDPYSIGGIGSNGSAHAFTPVPSLSLHGAHAHSHSHSHSHAHSHGGAGACAGAPTPSTAADPPGLGAQYPHIPISDVGAGSPDNSPRHHLAAGNVGFGSIEGGAGYAVTSSFAGGAGAAGSTTSRRTPTTLGANGGGGLPDPPAFMRPTGSV